MKKEKVKKMVVVVIERINLDGSRETVIEPIGDDLDFILKEHYFDHFKNKLRELFELTK